jgi:hypothetical protein
MLLPQSLGGQDRRVMWLDVDLAFNVGQLARMVGFEIMARIASRAYPHVLEVVSADQERVLHNAFDQSIPEAARPELNATIDRLVTRCLDNLVVYECVSTTKLLAACSAVEARLALRSHTVGAIVIDSLSALRGIWQGQEQRGGAECHRVLLASVGRIRSVYGVTVFLSQVETGQVVQVEMEALRRSLGALDPSCATCLLSSSQSSSSGVAAAVTGTASDSLPIAGSLGSAEEDDDDDGMRTDMAELLAASMEGDEVLERVLTAARGALPMGKRPVEPMQGEWDKRITHKVQLARVKPDHSLPGVFGALMTDVFCARLLKAPGKALPFRQLWPFQISGAGLIEWDSVTE